MEMLLKCFEAALSIFEVWLCYQFLFCTILEKKYLSKIERIIIYSNILIIGYMLFLNRNLLFFSHLLFLFCVVATCLCVWVVKKKDVLAIMAVVLFYYSIIALLDFFFAFLSITFLSYEFDQKVYVGEFSVWKIGIYFLSRFLIGIFFLFTRKTRGKNPNNFMDYKKQLLIMNTVFLIVLRRYQHILYDVSEGTREIDGNYTGLTLLATVVTVLFIGIIVYKYQSVQKENEYLILRDELSSQYYQGAFELLEKNQYLVHDVRNHILILRKYEKEGDIEKIHDYLEELQHEFLNNNVEKWTGNQVLDFLLNQKKMLSKEAGISFNVEANAVGCIKLSDSELCALFANLLDNAIEACKQVGEGGRKININIKNQNQLLFVEISNSIGVIPVHKNNNWISQKTSEGAHGYGLKSVERVIKKYDGIISYQIKGNEFYVNLSLFDI